jgi:hypothetical protein
MTELKVLIQTPDGQFFDTKAEAVDHMRRPKILAALKSVTDGNQELTDWLVDNRETVEMAFEIGTIKRVSKGEKKKLDKALDFLRDEHAEDKKLAFLVENVEAIRSSFRWPKVNRMSPEQKKTAARNSLVAATDGNEEVADWILKNEEAILEAYKAGIEKREMPQKTLDALAAYRAKLAASEA